MFIHHVAYCDLFVGAALETDGNVLLVCVKKETLKFLELSLRKADT